MKRKNLAPIAITGLLFATVVVVCWPIFARWRENTRRSAIFYPGMETWIYRSDAPPLIIEHLRGGVKKYYWHIEGQKIYKRTEYPA